MKFKLKKYRVGDERVIKKFLLIPRTIESETKWLEFAEILQEYIEDWNSFQGTHYRWVDRSWVW